MIEVKKSGRYKMRNGDLCEVYGFTGSTHGPSQARGTDLKNKNQLTWNCDTGKLEVGLARPNEQFDIVEALPPGAQS